MGFSFNSQSLVLSNLPSLFRLLVDVGQYVGSATRPLAHHHGHRRGFLKVLQNSQDDVGTALEDQRHNGNTLTDSYDNNETATEMLSSALLAPNSYFINSSSHPTAGLNYTTSAIIFLR